MCWSTSLWPIIQSGLKPKFVDVKKETLNLDLNDLEKNLQENQGHYVSTCSRELY